MERPDLAGNCLGAETLLAFAEGRLGAPESERVEGHAARCGECREVLSALEGRGDEAAGQHSEAAGRGDEAVGPGSRVGRYEVLGHVGEGGMGVVYAAFDPELDRKVALKLLRRDLDAPGRRHHVEERLRREAQAMARLQHPNVAAVYDVGRYGGRAFVAMEFVEGETLAAWLERDGRRPLREALDRFVAAGRGLAAAHAAGLVHRDFKPQNVLCGDDGRVRVVDFGLARLAEHGGEGEGVSPGVLALGAHPDLTATGALLGTPSYMASEQLRGVAADAKSDQFSFCVALYEALYGERPFAGDTPKSLLEAIEAGRVSEPPRGARVPRRVRRALLRGLATSPGDRFASMDDLLAALTLRPRRRLGAVALGAALALGAAGGALLARRPAEVRAPCADGARRLEQVWGEARRRAAAEALLRTGVPYAEAAAREATRALDAYAARWGAQYVGACEATKVRGDQSEEIMGLRMACLDERLGELKAFGDRLIEADRGAAERAVSAAHWLSGLDACADARAIAGRVPPPADPAVRAEIEGLRSRLIEARSLRQAGRYREGLAAATPLVGDARRLRYRPLEAEALFLLGELFDDAGDFVAAETNLGQAALAAEAGRDDELTARALGKLVLVQGLRLARYDQIESLEQRAGAVIERLGGPAELEAQLLFALGRVNLQRARYPETERELTRALELFERRYGEDDLRAADPLGTLGWLAIHRGQGHAAAGYFERAIAIERRALGDDHPTVVASLSSVASAQLLTGDYARAEANFRQTLAGRERSFGPDDYRVSNVLGGLALACEGQGRYDEAVALHRRAAEIAEKTRGAEHPTTGITLVALGAALGHQGSLGESLRVLERALDVLRRRYGDEHSRVAEALHELGRTQMRLGRPREALASVQSSRAIYQRVLGDEYSAGEVWQTIGEIFLRSGQAARAVEPLEEAHLAHGRSHDAPKIVAQTTALLARAVYEAGREPARAAALAREARESLQGAPGAAAELAAFDRWARGKRLLAEETDLAGR
jgi:eukaryotic-like serine/threonine-protein kinase